VKTVQAVLEKHAALVEALRAERGRQVEAVLHRHRSGADQLACAAGQ
jgi:DNA-binding FadR family transcriptional regulator